MEVPMELLITFPFIFSGFVNLIYLAAGGIFLPDRVRSILFIASGILYFVTTFLLMIRKKEIHISWRFFIVPFFWILFYGLAIIRYSRIAPLMESIKRYLVFGTTAYAWGIMISRMHLEHRLLQSLERISILLIPAALLYTMNVYLHHGSYFDLSFGPVTYMTVAYTLLPLFAALVLTLDGRSFSMKNIANVLIALFFWYVMLLTTTRGAIFGVLFFAIVLFLYDFFYARKNKLRIFTTALVLLLFAIINLGGIEGSLKKNPRMSIVISSLEEGEFKTSDRGAMKTDDLMMLVNDPHPTTNSELIKKGMVVNGRMNIGDRITLYRLALLETKAHPLTGLGSFGFHAKYGLYPHNFILEAYADFGVIGASVLLLGLFALLVRLFIAAHRSLNTKKLLLFFVAHLVMVLVSGSLYDMAMLQFGIGYAAFLTLPRKLNALSTEEQ